MKSNVMAIAAICASSYSCATSVTAKIAVIDYDTREYVTNAVLGIDAENPLAAYPLTGWTLSPPENARNGWVFVFDAPGPHDCSFATPDGEFGIGLTANGYYVQDAGGLFRFPGAGANFGSIGETCREIEICLRKKRHPQTMYTLGAGRCCMTGWYTEYRFPENATEAGFDMMAGDWVEPYGKGETADFFVQKERIATNETEHVSAALVFRGDGNGAYIAQKVPNEFMSAYNADPEAVYVQTFPHIDGCIVGTNSYLVVRTRAETGANGAMASAHYGKIYGEIKVESDGANASQTYFYFMAYALNPIKGNTNLETTGGNDSLVPIRQVHAKGSGVP